MTHPLNFTTKAIADLTVHAANPGFDRSDRAGMRFIASLLRKAQVFVLPECGEIVDRGRGYPEVPPTIYHPPFPVVALEYRAADRGPRDPIYEATIASRRISLAWEWDGELPFELSRGLHLPEAGSGVAIASVCYFDDLRTWVPMVGAITLPYEGTYVEREPMLYERAFRESGRLRRPVTGRVLENEGLLPILPDSMAKIFASQGAELAFSLIAADLMDEVNAFRDLSLALACNNVTAERQDQPARLNRARIRAGKVPLKDFHILKIGGGDALDGGGSGTNAGGRRTHLRRGHVRRISPDRITWVNSCMVRGSNAGFASKQYAPVSGGTTIR